MEQNVRSFQDAMQRLCRHEAMVANVCVPVKLDLICFCSISIDVDRKTLVNIIQHIRDLHKRIGSSDAEIPKIRNRKR